MRCDVLIQRMLLSLLACSFAAGHSPLAWARCCHWEAPPRMPMKVSYYRVVGWDLPTRTAFWELGVAFLDRPLIGWDCAWWEDESQPALYGPVSEMNGENVAYVGQILDPGQEEALALTHIWHREGTPVEWDMCLNIIYDWGINENTAMGEWPSSPFDPDIIDLRAVWAHEDGHIWGLAHWSESYLESSCFDSLYPPAMIHDPSYLGYYTWYGDATAPVIAAICHCGDVEGMEVRFQCTGPVATHPFHSLRAAPAETKVVITIVLIREVHELVLHRLGPEGPTEYYLMGPDWQADENGRYQFVLDDTGVRPGASYRYWLEVGDFVSPATPWVKLPGLKWELGAAPNPLNSGTTVVLTVPTSGWGEISIFDTLGRKVLTLQEGMIEQGRHHIRWGGGDREDRRVASGVYFCRARFEDRVLTDRLIVLR